MTVSRNDFFIEQDLGFAKIDHDRVRRRGLPEAVFGPGKTPEEIRDIAREIARRGDPVIVTKTGPEAFRLVREACPRAVWHEKPRLIAVPGRVRAAVAGEVAVLAAGTSDIPMAEEAAVTLEAFGARAARLYDVGVAGLHRLLARRRTLARAQVVVVAAGMDGALPSVVSGLGPQPVIAVPTSVGYGASFQGVAALLSMMNSCSPGVAVVNIDNGFGAGYLALSILRAGRRRLRS